MSTINLGLRYVTEEESNYICGSLAYLNIPAFLEGNFIDNINFLIHMLVQNRDNLQTYFPPDHLIAYLWLLKEVAEKLKEE